MTYKKTKLIGFSIITWVFLAIFTTTLSSEETINNFLTYTGYTLFGLATLSAILAIIITSKD